MKMKKLQIKEKAKAPNVKSVKDSFTNTIYKRPFLLEKIKKDIYGKKYYNIVKSNNSDKQLLKLKKTLKKKVNKINLVNSNFSASNNYEHLYKFIGKLNNNLQLKSIENKLKELPIKKTLRRQRSDFDLPIINSKKTRKEPIIEDKNKTMILINDNSKEKIQENIANSEIPEPKEFYDFKPKIIKIRSFVNTSRKSDLSINNEHKIYNINEINNKYNLKLNLSNNREKKISNIFHGKKYTIVGMLNKLFEYYSSSQSHLNDNLSNFDNFNQTNNYINNSNSNSI